MASCQHAQHTHMCSAATTVLLCFLFHVHLHLAHASDIQNNGNSDLGLSDVHGHGEESWGDTLPARSSVNTFTLKLFQKYSEGDVMTIVEFEQFLIGLGMTGISSRGANERDHRNNFGDDDVHVNHASHINDDTSHNNKRSVIDSFFDMTPGDNDIVDEFSPPMYNTLEQVRRSTKDVLRETQQPGANLDRLVGSKTNGKEGPSSDSRLQRSTSAFERKRITREAATDGINDDDEHQCPSIEHLYALSHSNYSSNDVLAESLNFTITTFENMFPAILYQLDVGLCTDGTSMVGRDGEHEAKHVQRPFWEIPLAVWLWAIAAIVVISLVGLLSVAIIPLTSKVIYNHLLQFLVALAVGTLTGDACLHLLPHAMAGESHSHGSHNDGTEGSQHHDAVFKGLAALMGIYAFFLIEQGMKIYSGRKRQMHKTKREAEAVEGVEEEPLKAENGEPQVAFTAVSVRHKVQVNDKSCQESILICHKDVKDLAQDAHDDVHRDCEKSVNVNVGAHSHHGHAHNSKMHKSVASVAWMVVMGDGIHNFGDGLAIGAAFANNISVGLSTTIAVFCHELPHEIGDFAVLLRAGMTAKQAITYNIVSSILAVFGMLIGLLVGNISSASLWIFAVIGGMFIYVALVDMMPELTAVDPHSGESPLWHFLLQNAGMILGFLIMFIIALFEEDITVPGL